MTSSTPPCFLWQIQVNLASTDEGYARLCSGGDVRDIHQFASRRHVEKDHLAVFIGSRCFEFLFPTLRFFGRAAWWVWRQGRRSVC